MLTVGLLFVLAIACQLKTSKIGITIYHLPSSSYAIYKIETILKALILINLILQKIPKIVDFIFLSNCTLQDESNKICFTKIGHS